MKHDHVKTTRDTYNKIASDYVKRKESSKLWAFVNYVVVRNFLKNLPKASGGDILVVGPAGGHTTIQLAKKSGRFVLGIDFSEGMVAEAEKLRKRTGITNCTFEVGDITEVKLRTTFDGIFCDGVLYHIPREKLPSLLRSFARVLSSDGVLYANFKKGQGFELQENPVTYPGSPRAYWFYDMAELKEVFEKAGFSAVIKPAKLAIFGEHFIEVTAKLKR
jgi:ubiquinone/menaquinone biosynthesis C-methylase UbiE